MSLNETPKGERIHIGIFGKRNAGKSSLINALTSQSIAVISDTPGTTTDPVSKAMEILPIGPVLIIDTPGFDDDGDLGKLRVEKTREVLRKTDIAILVLGADVPVSENDVEFISLLKSKHIPYIICVNKCDVRYENDEIKSSLKDENLLYISAKTLEGVNELKNRLALLYTDKNNNHLIADLMDAGDTAVLVIPIDESAPKGRLILPQQQVIRDLLEASCTVVVTKDTELEETLLKLKDKPKVVITDSQAFSRVSKIVPEDVYLTSFSILMARYKGDLEWQVSGAKAIEKLQDGSKVLISEGCSHHRQCGDIGTVKLPAWINGYTGKKIVYDFTSGGEFPEDISSYDLIVHCGGCTLNEKEMKYRIDKARKSNVPITNYGVLIAYINGILKRSLDLLTL